jgi:hypothetical protein
MRLDVLESEVVLPCSGRFRLVMQTDVGCFYLQLADLDDLAAHYSSFDSGRFAHDLCSGEIERHCACGLERTSNSLVSKLTF